MVDGWQKVYKLINRIGFMQGRLSSIVDGKIQSFPWEEWEKEFERAFEIQLSIMEWTLDYQELRKNPLMTVQGREKINNLSKKYNLSIPSLTGDCFMQKPFWKTIKSDNSNLVCDLENILEASKKVGIKMILIPLVDSGKIENLTQENLFVDVCLSMQSFLKNNQMFLIFESDYPPDKLSKFIDRFPSEQYGINYDIGNSAALGFNPFCLAKLIDSSILFSEILKHLEQISVKIGVAPSMLITSAVETKVNETVITASPGPIPFAINGINNASVPEEQVMACLVPTYFDKRSSNS